MPKYLKITISELEALIETAETCKTIGDELSDEANAAVKAYKAVLKRNGMVLEGGSTDSFRTENIR